MDFLNSRTNDERLCNFTFQKSECLKYKQITPCKMFCNILFTGLVVSENSLSAELTVSFSCTTQIVNTNRTSIFSME